MQLCPVFVFGVCSYPERFSDDKCELKICMTPIPENRMWSKILGFTVVLGFWLGKISSEINSARAADIAVV